MIGTFHVKKAWVSRSVFMGDGSGKGNDGDSVAMPEDVALKSADELVSENIFVC